jgi:uncharacterized protein (TIGR00369 family)
VSSPRRARLRAIIDAHHAFGDVRIDAVGAGELRLRKGIEARDLRLDGSVTGPTLMTLADAAVYLALQTETDLLGAVTSQLNIHFLRRPPARDVIAAARILRRGRTLAVGEGTIYSEIAPGDEELVAQAIVTYALPGRGA